MAEAKSGMEKCPVLTAEIKLADQTTAGSKRLQPWWQKYHNARRIRRCTRGNGGAPRAKDYCLRVIGLNGNFSREDLASLVPRGQILSLGRGNAVKEETKTGYSDQRSETAFPSHIFFSKQRMQAHVPTSEEEDTSDSGEEAETPDGSMAQASTRREAGRGRTTRLRAMNLGLHSAEALSAMCRSGIFRLIITLYSCDKGKLTTSADRRHIRAAREKPKNVEV